MHTPETQQKFVQRRAEGWTFTRIATELGVAKNTLIEWSRKYRFQISNQKAIAAEELHARVLGTREHRVSMLAEKLSRVEEELRKRDLAKVNTARLYSLSDSLRRQIEREAGDTSFITPIKEIPDDEYVEQFQEWKP